MIILEKHPVSGYEPRHDRREPDDVLTRRVDVDIDMDAGRRVIRVERAVVRAAGGFVVGPPRAMPVVVPSRSRRTSWGAVQEHLAGHVGHEPDDLLVPAQHGGHLAASTLNRHFYPARTLVGRPTFASTTCGTPVPCWPRPPESPWPS